MSSAGEVPEGGWKHEAAMLTKDGETVDITRELAVMFDLVVGSMNWGSGFFDQEDMQAIIKIGQACGFDVPKCERSFFLYEPDETQRHGQRVAGTGHCELDELHQGLHQGHVFSSKRIDVGMVWGLRPGHTFKTEKVELGIMIWNDEGQQVIEAQPRMTLQVES